VQAVVRGLLYVEKCDLLKDQSPKVTLHVQQPRGNRLVESVSSFLLLM